MEQIITNEQKALLKLISNVVFLNDIDFSKITFDMNNLLKEAKHQAVIPIAFEGCIKNGLHIDNSVYMEYFTKSAKIIANNQNLLSVQDMCKKVFDENSIPFTIIKGAAVSSLYNDPGLRSMGDIDILVSPKDFENAVEVLKHSGFVYKGGEGDIHREFIMNGCIVELHFEINGIPVGKNGDKIRDVLKNSLSNREFCYMEGYSFPCPSPYIHGVVLLLHMYEHLQTGGIGLRHLCDWGVFALRYLNNTPQCYEILDEFKKLSIYTFCQIMTATAKTSFEIPFDFEWCGDIDEKLKSEVLFDIFEGGNFGYKNPEERYMSDILVKRSDDENKGSVSRGISNFRKRINTSMPITKKHPSLIAVAPFYIPVRYIYRVATGKRKKVNAVKMVKKSSQRRSLYDKFEMFK